MLAHAKAQQPSAWCHRHLAAGKHVPAVRTRVLIDVEILTIAPDLCRSCLQDVDSWLRLFGIREVAEPDSAEEQEAGGLVLICD